VVAATVVPFYAGGLAVLEATDNSSGKTSIGTIAVYFYGLTNQARSIRNERV
jgi:hypothetical protein